MKKISILFSATALAFVMTAGTGCLKDDEDFGINISEKKAVSFPENGEKSIAVNSQATPLLFAAANASIENSGAAGGNIQVSLSVDNTSVPTDIDGNGDTLTLPSGSFSIPASLTIPAGKTLSDTMVITFNNTSALNATAAYFVGVKITSVDQGYIVAENQKLIIFKISIKNKYDGVYSMTGRHNRTPYDFLYQNIEMDMVTSGPNSVRFYWPEAGDWGHPIGTSPTSVSWYGNTVSPNVTFDLTTNLVTNVNNADPGGSPVIDIYTGAGSGTGRYDPATKTMYVYWRYSSNNLRAFMDTLYYVKPR